MPTIRVRNGGSAQLLVAGATLFPLQGNQYEYLPFNARVEFAIVGREGGTDLDTIGNVRATVFSGSDILQQSGPITDKTATTAQTQNAVYPDDFLLDDVAAAGERLSVQLDIPATTTGDAVFDTVVKITPL